jgi:hypothetical protein
MLIAIDTPIPMSDKDRSSGDESPQQAAVVDDIDAEKRLVDAVPQARRSARNTKKRGTGATANRKTR